MSVFDFYHLYGVRIGKCNMFLGSQFFDLVPLPDLTIPLHIQLLIVTYMLSSDRDSDIVTIL
uniref:Uncharacterized protein n=1 Tax=Octopus bimaculoides TaxID=37653 RepID=A0A0L8HZW4_OCTBM